MSDKINSSNLRVKLTDHLPNGIMVIQTCHYPTEKHGLNIDVPVSTLPMRIVEFAEYYTRKLGLDLENLPTLCEMLIDNGGNLNCFQPEDWQLVGSIYLALQWRPPASLVLGTAEVLEF